MLIGYTLVGTNDLQRAMAFYDDLFGAVGVGRIIELPRLAGWGVDWNKPIFVDGNRAPPGLGPLVAGGQRTRSRVDTLHAKALELGGLNEGAPGVRGQEGVNAFYAAYVRDLDGNKLGFYCVGPAEKTG
jgi:catechol 2,3-dioxygenase-like lactoylglutathione lyase family enzyme